MKIFVCDGDTKRERTYNSRSLKLLEILLNKHDLVLSANSIGIGKEAYRIAKASGRNITVVRTSNDTGLDCTEDIVVDSTLGEEEKRKAIIDSSDVLLFLPNSDNCNEFVDFRIMQVKGQIINKMFIIFDPDCRFFRAYDELGLKSHVCRRIPEVVENISITPNNCREHYETFSVYVQGYLSDFDEYPYSIMRPYFEYPFVQIESEVALAEIKGYNTDSFYEEQIKKLATIMDAFRSKTHGCDFTTKIDVINASQKKEIQDLCEVGKAKAKRSPKKIKTEDD